MPREVWNQYRQWMSNLVPLLLSVPVFVAGMLFYQQGRMLQAFVFWGAFPVVGWLAVNFLGLFQNGRMMRVLRPRFLDEYPELADSAVFVGFARPKYRSLLEAHEDIGWLLLHRDRIEFLGERQRHSLAREEIHGARFRANAHSLLGLGRWISIEGMRDGKPVRLMIEPRQRGSLLANKRLSGTILNTIQEWIKAER